MPYQLTKSPGLAAALTLALAVAATATPAAGELNTFKSRFYTVHTTLSKEDVRPLAHHMDLVFAHYKRRFKNFDRRNTQPQDLYLFRKRGQYVQFIKQHGIPAKNSGGMFFVARDARGLATYVQGRQKEQVLEVLQHEGFHQFAWNYIGRRLPQWVNEGLAQYFEDAKIRGGDIELGRADRRRLRVLEQAMRKDRLMPLEKIIKLDNRQWNNVLNSDAEAGTYMYAQAWSMVYFLIHGDNGRYQDAFKQYLHMLADGKANNQAVEKAFDTSSFEAMRRRWLLFMKRRWFD